MSIPCKIRPAGLESLPMGYTRLNFLESTGTQYCGATGISPERLSTITRFEVTYDKFCVVISTYGTNPKEAYYIDSSTTSKGQVYKDSTTYSFSQNLNIGDIAEVEINAEQDYIRVNNSKKYFTNLAKGFKNPRLNIGLFAQAPIPNASAYMRGKCYFVKMTRAGKAVVNFIPALDPSGRPCMFDTVSKQPSYNAATTGSDFIVGMTLGQALKLKDLPAKTATLDISLPEGYEAYEEVMESIRQAEEKGWTINKTTYTPT